MKGLSRAHSQSSRLRHDSPGREVLRSPRKCPRLNYLIFTVPRQMEFVYYVFSHGGIRWRRRNAYRRSRMPGPFSFKLRTSNWRLAMKKTDLLQTTVNHYDIKK